ncbi:hypothetical protein K490DRAFT_60656 [Saccharata proteae CBS 121410]|uniref:Uncharacterized protein n=1 Tax=Saccharata proteae CBS 121410 TaxID=1314787 RepID=A0A9P4HKI3_9PEZI|nr:hypothetical protein K490DRAFT_60656 [Saccharata proteae CBS 121410]
MSLLRGIQSAIFYYVSCAPCFGYAHQRRRKKQNRRDRAEKAQAELDDPDAYRHPDVGDINPYWSEEIALGPGPPPKKMGKKARAAQRSTTAGTQDSMGSRADSSMDSRAGGAGITFGGEPTTSEDTLSDDGWNRRRYQREDEELWGSEEVVSMDGKVRISSSAGSSTGLVGLSRPGTGGSEGYYVPRAPPVNDLHPPVASMPAPNVSANKWMLQPPPSARVMSGKERIRSRSGSGTSSRVDVTSLQREISVRKIEEKIARGETPEMPPVSRGSSYRASPTSLYGQRHDRDPRKSPSLTPSMSSRRSKRRSRVTATPEESEDTASDDALDLDREYRGGRVAGTPLTTISGNVERRTSNMPRSRGRGVDKLSTVESSSASPEPLARVASTMSEKLKPVLRHSTTAPVPTLSLNKTRTASPFGSKHREMVKPERLVIRDSSLNILQELVSPPTLLNSPFIKSPTLEARIQLPPTNSTEELDLRSLSPWFPSDDFAVAADAENEENAAFRQRWSMDL